MKITRGADVVFQIHADGTNHIGGPEGQCIATAQAVTSVLESLKSVSSTWAATVTGATKAKAT